MGEGISRAEKNARHMMGAQHTVAVPVISGSRSGHARKPRLGESFAH